MDEEIIVAWTPSRAAVPPLHAVRSTVISSSILSLRARGYGDRYLAALPPEHHDMVLYTPAGIWRPAVHARAHYAACDQLGIASQEIVSIGSDVARTTQKSILSGILRLAKEAGTTPWALYRGCGNYWSRSFQGSAIGIFKLGPKEVRFEVTSCALCESPYWRSGLRGLLGAVSEPFAQKVYVRELPQLASATTCGYRISWV